MDRYIGLDAHGKSCTFAVLGPSGRKLRTDVVETSGSSLVEYLRSIGGQRRLCLEEGTQSSWLYELLEPHVAEIVVTPIGQSRGQKSDAIDAFKLAEALRTGSIRGSVFKAPRELGRLRELVRVHSMLVSDVMRVQLRMKSMYRARSVDVSGRAVYAKATRESYLRQMPTRCQWAIDKLYEQYDAVLELKKDAEKELIKEARKHPMFKKLHTVPGLGPIRVAQLLAVVVTPHRFRTKRQLWAYSGLGLVMRSSSDWVRTENGGWARANVQMTRGLNRNHNARMKNVFKGAATFVVGQKIEPLYQDYMRLLNAGTKPNLATLTIARKIAAITLRMWKNEEVYDPKAHCSRIT